MRKIVFLTGLIAVLSGALLAAESVKATSVLDAVKTGNIAAVQNALQQHGDANEADAEGTSALHWAVYHGDSDLVTRLLAAGADANARNDYGSTPMSEAAVRGDRSLAAQAFALDPLAGRGDLAEIDAMVAELLAGTAEWLPQFA